MMMYYREAKSKLVNNKIANKIKNFVITEEEKECSKDREIIIEQEHCFLNNSTQYEEMIPDISQKSIPAKKVMNTTDNMEYLCSDMQELADLTQAVNIIVYNDNKVHQNTDAQSRNSINEESINHNTTNIPHASIIKPPTKKLKNGTKALQRGEKINAPKKVLLDTEEKISIPEIKEEREILITNKESFIRDKLPSILKNNIHDKKLKTKTIKRLQQGRQRELIYDIEKKVTQANVTIKNNPLPVINNYMAKKRKKIFVLILALELMCLLAIIVVNFFLRVRLKYKLIILLICTIMTIVSAIFTYITLCKNPNNNTVASQEELFNKKEKNTDSENTAHEVQDCNMNDQLTFTDIKKYKTEEIIDNSPHHFMNEL